MRVSQPRLNQQAVTSPATQEFGDNLIRHVAGIERLWIRSVRPDTERRRVRLQLDGANLLPALTSPEATPPHDALYWRNQSRFAIRVGDWKLVKSGKVAGKATVADAELYNLHDDPSESRNLADSEREKVRMLGEKWEEWNKTLILPRWGTATDQDSASQDTKPRKKKKQN